MTARWRKPMADRTRVGGYVYAAARCAFDGLVKIGYTGGEPTTRVARLRPHCNLIAVHEAVSRSCERSMHVRYRAHWVGGEWFEVPPELLRFLARLAPPPPSIGKELRGVGGAYKTRNTVCVRVVVAPGQRKAFRVHMALDAARVYARALQREVSSEYLRGGKPAAERFLACTLPRGAA